MCQRSLQINKHWKLDESSHLVEHFTFCVIPPIVNMCQQGQGICYHVINIKGLYILSNFDLRSSPSNNLCILLLPN